MDRYILKLQTFIKMGRLLALLSACKRLQVSAIIFPTDCSRVYAIGYNGPPRGVPNDACSSAEGVCGCVHAEANALIKFNDEIARPSIMFVTTQPCQQCASMILNCRSIVGLIFDKAYRVGTGIQLIENANRIGILSSEALATPDARRILERWRSIQ